MQTLASQLSSSFDQDLIVEKTFIQTLASQLSSSFDQDMIVEKTLMRTLASHQLSASFDQVTKAY